MTGEKNGSIPTSRASSASSREQKAWNVETWRSSYGDSMSDSSRSLISAAAGDENVSASTSSGAAPCSTSQAKRVVTVRVLPLPAPAITSRGPPGCVTASRWERFRPSSRSRIPA